MIRPFTLLLLLSLTLSSHAQFFYQGSCGSNAEFKVTYIDNDVFACTHFNSLDFYSIANPSNPSLLSSVSLGFTFPVLAICRSGNQIFTQGYNSTAQFTVVDISNLNSPSVQGQCLWGSYTGIDIEVQGNFAYVLGYDSIMIYNISNLAAPFHSASIDFIGNPCSDALLIKNNQLFVGTNMGLTIFDINGNGTLSYNNNLLQLAVTGELISDSLRENIFCSNDSVTNVYDFTQTSNPVFKFQIPIGGSLCSKGNYLYNSDDSINVTRILNAGYIRVASMGKSNLAPVFDIDAKDSSIVLVCSRDSILTYSFNRNSTLGISKNNIPQIKPYQLNYTATSCEIEGLENQLKVEVFDTSGKLVESFELTANRRKQLQIRKPGLYFLRLYSSEKKQVYSERMLLTH